MHSDVQTHTSGRRTAMNTAVYIAEIKVCCVRWLCKWHKVPLGTCCAEIVYKNSK